MSILFPAIKRPLRVSPPGSLWVHHLVQAQRSWGGGEEALLKHRQANSQDEGLAFIEHLLCARYCVLTPDQPSWPAPPEPSFLTPITYTFNPLPI